MGKVIHAVFVRKPSVNYPEGAKVLRLHHPEQHAYLLYMRATGLDENPASYQEALELYRQALDLSPEFTIAKINLAAVHYKMNRPRIAHRLWKESVVEDPTRPEPHYNMGFAAIEQGRWKSAVRHLVNALRVSPDYEDTHFLLGEAYAKLRKHLMAISHWERYLVLLGGRPDMYLTRSRIEASRLALATP